MKKRAFFLLFFILMLNKGCITDEELASFRDSSLSREADFFTYNGADEGMDELIRAVQYYRFYHKDMQSEYKNYEFEAKVFRDLAILCNEEGIKAAPYAPVQMYPMNPSHNSSRDSYILWIEDVGQFKEFTGSDYADYAHFCQMWDRPSYPGVYNSSIEPKLLKCYFPKRIPEP